MKRRVASSRFERTTTERLRVNAAADAIWCAEKLRRFVAPNGVPKILFSSYDSVEDLVEDLVEDQDLSGIHDLFELPEFWDMD